MVKGGRQLPSEDRKVIRPLSKSFAERNLSQRPTTKEEVTFPSNVHTLFFIMPFFILTLEALIGRYSLSIQRVPFIDAEEELAELLHHN